MKPTFLHSCCLLVLAASASAEIIGVEQFDYTNGPVANQTGGTFWDWQNRNTPAPGPRHTGTFSDWDNFSGAPLVTNGRLVTDNTSAKREYNGPGEGPGGNIETDEGYGAINNFSNGTISFQQHTVYYRVSFTTGATVPSFISISSSDFGTDRVVFGSGVFAGNPRFAIGDIPATSYSISGTAPAPNTSYTLVAKLDFVSGNATLYLNPDLNAAESSQTPLRGAFPFSTAFWSTSVRLASGTGGAVTWDDLVVATAWRDLGTVVNTTADTDGGASVLNAGGAVSLREAVKYSTNGALITFAPALNGRSCILSLGDMLIDRAVTIDASGLANGVTIDANGSSRHFSINSAAAQLTLKSLTLINGNSAFQNGGNDAGGAILLFQGKLLLQRCTLCNNAGGAGGVLFQQSATSSRFEHCTFVGNVGHDFAGALEMLGGTCALSRCTVTGNASAGAGGGLLVQSPANVSLEGCIVAGNKSPNFNDIFRLSGTVTAIGTNLIGSNPSVESTFPIGPLAGTQAAPLDPKLSPLGYFGGPTQTLHPLIGSPAIDAGGTTDPGGTDQRGFPRFVDGDGDGTAKLDIGAVEAWPHARSSIFPDHPVTTAVDEDDGSILSGIGTGTSLREAVKYAPLNGSNGFVITFAPALAGQTITLGGSEIPLNTNLFIDASDLSGPVTISGNHASRVFNIAAGATVAMQNLVIINGQTENGSSGFIGGDGGSGAGIFSAGSLSLFSCSITGNRTGDGGDGTQEGGVGGYGGGISSSGRLNLVSCRVTGNQTGRGGDGSHGGSGGNGGGISSGSGPLSLISCSVVGNQTGNSGDGSTGLGGDGGGISSSGDLYLTSSTVSGNTTGSGNSRSGLGGGVNAFRSVIRSSTIAGNQADDGGGLFVDISLLLDQGTIAGNTAADGGGILGNLSSTPLTLRNSIVARNTASTGPDVSSGAVTFAGANLLGNPNGPASITGPTPNVADPQLAPLGNYGGPTQTMPPLPGSPAINVANDSTAVADQRGFPIVGPAPDIGAVEVQVAATNAPVLKNITRTSGGGGSNVVQFTFTNTPTGDFTVLASTNAALALTNWTVLGNAQQTASGQFQFTDTQTTNLPRRFYRVKSP